LLDPEQSNGGLSEESVDFFRNIGFVRASTVYPNLVDLFKVTDTKQAIEPTEIR
jgi:hypothetical protein